MRTDGSPPLVWHMAGGRIILWNGMKILHIQDRGFRAPMGIAVDWVIVGHDSLDEISTLRDKIAFKRIILDSSNSFFFASRFLEAAKLYKLSVHSVLHQGAFISKIENRST